MSEISSAIRKGSSRLREQTITRTDASSIVEEDVIAASLEPLGHLGECHLFDAVELKPWSRSRIKDLVCRIPPNDTCNLEERKDEMRGETSRTPCDMMIAGAGPGTVKSHPRMMMPSMVLHSASSYLDTPMVILRGTTHAHLTAPGDPTQ